MQYPITAPGVGLQGGKFTNGDPLLSISASLDRAEDMNRVYDELIAIVTEAGMTPSESDSNQVVEAIKALINPTQQYRVGDLYITTLSANPASTFGYGTWARYGQGKALVSLDSTNPLMDTVSETFGQADTVLPTHNHTITDAGHTHPVSATAGGTPGAGWYSSGPYVIANANVAATSNATTGITINNAGESALNKNYQPSIAVYVWVRTA